MMTRYRLDIRDGVDRGKSLRLERDGRYLVGRNPAADLRLDNPLAAWEQAAVLFENSRLSIENLAASDTQVNERPVADQVRLRTGDAIRFAPDTQAIVNAEGGGGVRLPTLLTAAVLSLLAVAMLVGLGMQDRQSAAPADDWDLAFRDLDRWVSGEVLRGGLPEGVVPLFRQAYRQDRARNSAAAASAYAKLNRLLLESGYQWSGSERSFAAWSAAYPDALEQILTAGTHAPAADDPQRAAALWQYVQRSLRFHLKALEEGQKP